MNTQLKVVGLTGGIGSGKSLVAGFMREAALPVIDADELAHMVIEPDGDAYAPVLERFGREILDDDGRIDREKLGRAVFDNSDERAALEAITHPKIAALAAKGMELIASRGESFVVYEAALLVEAGIYKGLDALVVVACPVAEQMNRIVSRDRISPEAAAKRIGAQYPLDEKVQVADYVIQNDGDFDQARGATLDVVAQLKERFGG